MIGDRASAATIPGDEGKFWASHNAVTRCTLPDPSVISSIVLVCRAKLVSANGLALNGVPKIMMALGCDAYPSLAAGINTGLFTGVFIPQADHRNTQIWSVSHSQEPPAASTQQDKPNRYKK